jgi:hypothetical protein
LLKKKKKKILDKYRFEKKKNFMLSQKRMLLQNDRHQSFLAKQVIVSSWSEGRKGGVGGWGVKWRTVVARLLPMRQIRGLDETNRCTSS